MERSLDMMTVHKWTSVVRTSCNADLCGGDYRLDQKVNEGLVVHGRQNPILHQTNLQTQRSQLSTGDK